MKYLFILSALIAFGPAARADVQEELQRFRKIVEPIIYSSSYEVAETDSVRYVENRQVAPEFKTRMRYVKLDMLEQLVSMFPWLCRPDFEDAESGCLSPLRGSEYYYVYDGSELLGFVFIGYIAEITPTGIGYRDEFAYRYIVHRSGRLVQNGFFDLTKK